MSTATLAKHTPGPWIQCHDLDGDYTIFADSKIIAITDLDRDEDKANACLMAASPDMFVAIAKLVCPQCDHELQHHADKYGCEIERGDGYRNAEFEEALGPCGCNDDDLRDDYPDFVRALEAFRKARAA
jgi:hypothetical protein